MTPAIYHCSSEPFRFFGRESELALLDQASRGGPESVVALVGPGGQGKTAIVRHWLEENRTREDLAGLFFWSFYRGKDSDLFLRTLYSVSEGRSDVPEVSAGLCVDRLLHRLPRERWVVLLDGAEVVQHETGSWQGRFVHPELARLIEELAGMRQPGVLVLTTRFPTPTLATRNHARIVDLGALDAASACGLLRSLGVDGTEQELLAAAQACGLHAKAVELLGTLLVHYFERRSSRHAELPVESEGDGSPEERHVARVLGAFHKHLPQDRQDIVALATAFRHPPTQRRVLEYLASPPVDHLLRETWGRTYPPLSGRGAKELRAILEELVSLRLLERVEAGRTEEGEDGLVLDAHPLVRRGFEHLSRAGGAQAGAHTRAGFLRGRPDRRPPLRLEEAREEVELFHAWCDAGMWNEADAVLVALDNPKQRFLAPAFERDLLLRFFPEGDLREPPLWQGFGRWRSLAICLEMLGEFEDALAVYRPADAPLRGDALIALGRLETLLATAQVPHPWQNLWQAYRAHALALAGRSEEALALGRRCLPMDIYEWVHVFECFHRLDRLDLIDLPSLRYRQPFAQENRWADLARRRMEVDFAAWKGEPGLDTSYRSIVEEYDRAGLPYERALTRLRFAHLLHRQGDTNEALAVVAAGRDLCRRHRMAGLEKDFAAFESD